jgi:N-acetylglucosamine-6-phosphate deacetylase
VALRRIAGRNVALELDDGVVRAVLPGDSGETRWLSPGFVDLQVNGWRGHDLNAPGLTAETVSAMVAALARTGTTTLLPTVITASEERMTAAVRAIAAACATDPRVAAAVAGIHVEGPHVSPNDGPRGAHPLADVRPPDIALFDRLQAAADGRVRMVTLSPHWPGSAAYVSALAARGIRVAIGHTDATRDETLAAVAAGATLSTHLGNGIAAMLPRHPNIIWTQLADDRLTATFIGDGHHLPVDTLKAMIRAKGPGRTVLVSDVTALGGMPPGVYRQPIGGDVELSPDGRLGLRGTPYLAGAARSLADGIAVTAGVVGMDLALRMATLNPGAILGGDAGRFVVGGPASLVRFAWSQGDPHLGIDLVLAGGRDVDLADGDGA